jgi:TetR/AcrR family transcriptional regulator, transcriptional repressor for nem operon
MNSTGHRAAAPRLTPKGERTRERIISIAADPMFDRGVSATTIDDVRAAAQVSASQLYHYFSDKAALVHAVIQYQADRVVGSQEPSLADLDSIQGLRAWRDGVVEMQRQTQCRGGCPIGSLASELADQDEQARSDIAAGFKRWHAGIRGGLRAMQDRGHLAADADPDNLALATLAAAQGGLLLGQVHRTTRPLEVALDAMIALIESLTRPIPESGATQAHLTADDSL